MIVQTLDLATLGQLVPGGEYATEIVAPGCTIAVGCEPWPDTWLIYATGPAAKLRQLEIKVAGENNGEVTVQATRTALCAALILVAKIRTALASPDRSAL